MYLTFNDFQWFLILYKIQKIFFENFFDFFSFMNEMEIKKIKNLKISCLNLKHKTK